MSRLHCSVVRQPDGSYCVVDNGSTNGTWVNGISIKSHKLENGDIVSIGTLVLRFSCGEGNAGDDPASPPLEAVCDSGDELTPLRAPDAPPTGTAAALSAASGPATRRQGECPDGNVSRLIRRLANTTCGDDEEATVSLAETSVTHRRLRDSAGSPDHPDRSLGDGCGTDCGSGDFPAPDDSANRGKRHQKAHQAFPETASITHLRPGARKDLTRIADGLPESWFASNPAEWELRATFAFAWAMGAFILAVAIFVGGGALLGKLGLVEIGKGSTFWRRLPIPIAGLTALGTLTGWLFGYRISTWSEMRKHWARTRTQHVPEYAEKYPEIVDGWFNGDARGLLDYAKVAAALEAMANVPEETPLPETAASRPAQVSSGSALVTTCPECQHVFRWLDSPGQEAPFCPRCGYDAIYGGRRETMDVTECPQAVLPDREGTVVTCDNCGANNRKTGAAHEQFMQFDLATCKTCGKTFCSATNCVGMMHPRTPCPHCGSTAGHSTEQYPYVATLGPIAVLDLADDAYKAIVPWSRPHLNHHVQDIAAMVVEPSPEGAHGLFDHREAIHSIGVEIESAHGFESMQYVWKTFCSLKGHGPAAELSAIWDRIGRWRR